MCVLFIGFCFVLVSVRLITHRQSVVFEYMHFAHKSELEIYTAYSIQAHAGVHAHTHTHMHTHERA
jgi:hypothetical protein